MALSQPYHIDYRGADEVLRKLFRDIDDMLGDLYQGLSSAGGSVTITGGTGITVTQVGDSFTISLTETSMTPAQVAAHVSLSVV